MGGLNRIAMGLIVGFLIAWGFVGSHSLLPVVETLPAGEPIVIESPFSPLIPDAPPGPEKPELPPPSDSGGSAGRATPAGTAPESPAPETEPAPDLAQFVHRINIGNSAGSCVSIGDGRFVTCWHVVESGGHQAVKIDGKWVRGQWRYDAANDVGVLTCDLDLPGVDVSTAVSDHMASATLVGLPGIGDEKQSSDGNIADYDLVAVWDDQPVIVQGQSGGGVFVEGKLVGVLRGFSAGRDAVPPNPRAAKFTALALVPALFDAQPVAAAPQQPSAEPAKSSGRWVQRCYNGQCR